MAETPETAEEALVEAMDSVGWDMLDNSRARAPKLLAAIRAAGYDVVLKSRALTPQEFREALIADGYDPDQPLAEQMYPSHPSQKK